MVSYLEKVLKQRLKTLLEEYNLHTIVRLPNGVFAPYTGINTNLLFFEKGKPTEEIWYFEHPLPQGYKNYAKTKPIRYEEFQVEKDWWNDREENEYAWRISIEEIKNVIITWILRILILLLIKFIFHQKMLMKPIKNQ